MRRSVIAVMSVVAVLLATGVAWGWSDNFNGGPQQTWSTYGDGSATVTNNRYELTATGTNTTAGVIAGYVSQSFTDGTVQAQIQQITEGDQFMAYLVARAGTGSGYVMGIAPHAPSPGPDYEHIWFGKLTAGAYTSLAFTGTQPTFDYTDCQAKFSIIGDTLQGKVWDTGSTEPVAWQITAIDSSYTSGNAGVMLATYPALINHVDVAFDNVTAVPEPGTLVLLGMAGLGLLAYAWRRRRS